MTTAADTATRFANILMEGQRSMAIIGVEAVGKSTLINQIIGRLPAGTRCAMLHDRVRDISRHEHLTWVDRPGDADVVVCGDMVHEDAQTIHGLSAITRTIVAVPANVENDVGHGVDAIVRRTGAAAAEVEATYRLIGIVKDHDGKRRLVMDEPLP